MIHHCYFFLPPLSFSATTPCVAFGISRWSYHQETRVMGLSCSEDRMIVA